MRFHGDGVGNAEGGAIGEGAKGAVYSASWCVSGRMQTGLIRQEAGEEQMPGGIVFQTPGSRQGAVGHEGVKQGAAAQHGPHVLRNVVMADEHVAHGRNDGLSQRIALYRALLRCIINVVVTRSAAPNVVLLDDSSRDAARDLHAAKAGLVQRVLNALLDFSVVVSFTRHFGSPDPRLEPHGVLDLEGYAQTKPGRPYPQGLQVNIVRFQKRGFRRRLK